MQTHTWGHMHAHMHAWRAHTHTHTCLLYGCAGAAASCMCDLLLCYHSSRIPNLLFCNEKDNVCLSISSIPACLDSTPVRQYSFRSMTSLSPVSLGGHFFISFQVIPNYCKLYCPPREFSVCDFFLLCNCKGVSETFVPLRRNTFLRHPFVWVWVQNSDSKGTSGFVVEK